MEGREDGGKEQGLQKLLLLFSIRVPMCHPVFAAPPYCFARCSKWVGVGVLRSLSLLSPLFGPHGIVSE